MKKPVIALALSACIAAAGFAQNAGPAAPAAPAAVQLQTVTVEGKLALVNGHIGLKAGSKTYYLSRLGQLAGFIDGIKEGAQVKVTGYERAMPMAPEYSTLLVTKITVNGKEYDLGQGFGPGAGGKAGRGDGPGRMGRGGRAGGGRAGCEGCF